MVNWFQALKTLALQHNQFGDHSLLWKAIKKTLNCADDKAKELAATHCNAFSWFAILMALEKINLVYEDYFRIGLDSGSMDKKGNISDKPKLCKALGFEYELDFVDISWEDAITPGKLDPKKLYQLRICTGRDYLGRKKNHFIAMCIQGGLLYIFDTGSRGVGVLASIIIKENQVEKILAIGA
jgi:hypothetical protein